MNNACSSPSSRSKRSATRCTCLLHPRVLRLQRQQLFEYIHAQPIRQQRCPFGFEIAHLRPGAVGQQFGEWAAPGSGMVGRRPTGLQERPEERERAKKPTHNHLLLAFALARPAAGAAGLLLPHTGRHLLLHKPVLLLREQRFGLRHWKGEAVGRKPKRSTPAICSTIGGWWSGAISTGMVSFILTAPDLLLKRPDLSSVAELATLCAALKAVDPKPLPERLQFGL